MNVSCGGERPILDGVITQVIVKFVEHLSPKCCSLHMIRITYFEVLKLCRDFIILISHYPHSCMTCERICQTDCCDLVKVTLIDVSSQSCERLRVIALEDNVL